MARRYFLTRGIQKYSIIVVCHQHPRNGWRIRSPLYGRSWHLGRDEKSLRRKSKLEPKSEEAEPQSEAAQRNVAFKYGDL